ncbi:MAG: transketolase [Candidatus Improbicoccus pseudotrichonymphae]|uniref:Transketolase n=1 Tax=Candidatus Improbicoccus pseudotrichonymphae TaxID=3033792 RepID=A0AA48I3G8_9FIRM|nr:MAG: transketolase [Candidatus Improbicoccus pseudotrichonymphae]
MEINKLKSVCREVRKNILIQMEASGGGHVGGCLSIVEVLVVLYMHFMDFDPKNPKKSNRDRLIVSKGHCGPAVYAILCYLGFFDKSWLYTLNKENTNLPSHCDMNKTPGVDMTSGSLGQGLSCAVGMAIALRLRGERNKIYTILGDGEIQEGQVWEAAMYAAHQKLSTLTVFIDCNKFQIDGSVDDVCCVEPIGNKWESFGWDVFIVKNGNDIDEIYKSISKSKKNNKPTAIILNTIKGYGIKFAESAGVNNHSMVIDSNMIKEGYEDIDKLH